MTDEEAGPPAIPPGLDWLGAAMRAPLRYQAAVAETLRAANAPMLDALRRQRALAEALGEAAERIAALSEQVAELARAHRAVTASLDAALAPYLRYLDSLAEPGQRPDAD